MSSSSIPAETISIRSKKGWTTETIENRQVFARNLKLTIKGEGYSVLGENEV